MRRVKKTTNEQFDLLKAEMAVHPTAARGYGVGAQRAVVDAEWKDIVEKLNALGPPERTMTEWKKVWSDVRLRIKKQSMRKNKQFKKSKKEPMHPEEDELMSVLNSSISIYETHIKSENNDDEQTQQTSKDDESYEGFDEEDHKLNENNSVLNINYEKTLSESPISQHIDAVEQTLISVQNQLEQQNKLLYHLSKVSNNITLLMGRHQKAMDKRTALMERQLKLSEYHNVFLRRQETQRKLKCKNPA